MTRRSDLPPEDQHQRGHGDDHRHRRDRRHLHLYEHTELGHVGDVGGERASYPGYGRLRYGNRQTLAAFVGVGYALVGIVFALPATHVQAWRLAAWVVSGIGYGAHIAYERFWLQNSPGSAALHVAFAAALGAFGLAVGANIHSLSSGSTNQHRQLLLLALGIWPVITGLPAFLVAFGTNMVLARALGRVQGQ